MRVRTAMWLPTAQTCGPVSTPSQVPLVLRRPVPARLGAPRTGLHTVGAVERDQHGVAWLVPVALGLLGIEAEGLGAA